MFGLGDCWCIRCLWILGLGLSCVLILIVDWFGIAGFVVGQIVFVGFVVLDCVVGGGTVWFDYV